MKYLSLAFCFFSASIGTDVTAQSAKNAQYKIGQEFGGGIIFYVDASGQHGLIASRMDVSRSTPWGCAPASDAGNISTSESVGTGASNTRSIVTKCSEHESAAQLCEALELNGFDDWYLPSKDELTALWEQRAIVGGFAGSSYWSSTAYENGTAWSQSFFYGLFGISRDRSAPGCVRPIRSF